MSGDMARRARASWRAAGEPASAIADVTEAVAAAKISGGVDDAAAGAGTGATTGGGGAATGGGAVPTGTVGGGAVANCGVGGGALALWTAAGMPPPEWIAMPKRVSSALISTTISSSEASGGFSSKSRWIIERISTAGARFCRSHVTR